MAIVLRKAMILSLLASSLLLTGQCTRVQLQAESLKGLMAGKAQVSDADEVDDAKHSSSEPTLREIWTQQLESAQTKWSVERPNSKPTWTPKCTELLGFSTTELPYAKFGTPLPSYPTLVSGGFQGADVLFGDAAANAGHVVVHILGPFNSATSKAAINQHLCRLEPAQLDNDKVHQQWSDVMAKRDKNWQEQDYMSLRNLFQVQDVDAVYAVATRLPAEEQPEVPIPMDIGGGTGLAAQAYINRLGPNGMSIRRIPAKCIDNDCVIKGKLWLFDDCIHTEKWKGCLIDEKTNKKWSKWNFETQEWNPLGDNESPNELPGAEQQLRYAGIGGRFINPAGNIAIGKLYDPKYEHTPSA